jgi:Trk K+ transport system NAD-binding subunit
VDSLIDELSIAAKEAIEKAAAESAKAATLAALEREAALLREASLQQADALYWRLQSETNLLAITVAKKAGIKNTIIAGTVCLFGGLVFGVTGTLMFRR